ncbi:DNA-directed RNA polymerase III subunit RPC5-like protein [Leptotrombidium deliense]|uniref:DNA-directed RNA polymerase III subunit RPC5-like protein n=1 Tax=Leptotrombidium deliense TaxID=299467 RepID=A0A443SEP2_9ACAR|nr:DNA-directed RNA polymerase III subunit RPC5-like protein [Leptotrombidium deliense]
MNSNGVDTEEDELLFEMDVFMNRRLQSNLHILQFPIGYSPLSANESCLERIRMKPKNKKIEVDVSLNTASKNFDRGKGEQIAYVANTSNEEEPYFPTNVMNKQTLKSAEVKPSLHQYCVGIIGDGSKELHLTPVPSVIQFRPSFHYFDKSEIRVNTKGTAVKEEPAALSEDETEVKRINVRFAALDEEKAKKMREMTYGYLQQQVNSEPWIDLEFHESDDIASQNERRLLLYNANDDTERNVEQTERICPILSIEEYLKSLVFNESNSSQPSSSSSTTQVKSLSLPEQVRTLISNAKVVSFNELKEYLLETSDDNTLLRYLQQYAMLVQGNWVVKSEILYPKEGGPTISPVSGAPIEALCRARDYVMWQFTQSQSVNRKEIMRTTKVSWKLVVFR